MERNQIEETIEFRISGKDYERLCKFKEEHDSCIEKLPNFSYARYEYTFVPDGFGVFKTVKCVCGEELVLTGDYDLGFADEPESPYKPTKTEDRGCVKKVMDHLKLIQDHPRLCFGKYYSWDALRFYVQGICFFARLICEDLDGEDIRDFAKMKDRLTGTVFEIDKEKMD